MKLTFLFLHKIVSVFFLSFIGLLAFTAVHAADPVPDGSYDGDYTDYIDYACYPIDVFSHYETIKNTCG